MAAPPQSSHRLVHSQLPTIHQIKGLYSERGASGRAGAAAKLQASAPRLPTLDRGPSPAQDLGPPAGPRPPLVHSFHTSIMYLLYATVSSLVSLLSLELCILGHAFLSHLLKWSWGGSSHPRWYHLPGAQFRGPYGQLPGWASTLCCALQHVIYVIPLTLPSPQRWASHAATLHLQRVKLRKVE